MNWEAISSIGELVGGVGVIITLLYLATQIRQNTRNLQQSASTVVNQALSDVNSRLSTDAEFVDIFLRGRLDIESLTPLELERFRPFIMDLLNLAVYVDGLKETHSVKPLHYDMAEIMGGYYQAYPGIRAVVDSAEDITPGDLIQRFRAMQPVELLAADNLAQSLNKDGLNKGG